MIRDVRISETMRKDSASFIEADGLWEKTSQTVIIKRSVLRSVEKYAGTLLHEIAHAISDKGDVDPEFENELTRLLGLVSSKSLGISE